jgi:hypothetical protein
VKVAEFNELCRREHVQDRGVVAKLFLTEESYAELLADVLSDDGPVLLGVPSPGVACGASLDAMVNPATRTLVSIGRAVIKGLFADTAEVARWVTVGAEAGQTA